MLNSNARRLNMLNSSERDELALEARAGALASALEAESFRGVRGGNGELGAAEPERLVLEPVARREYARAASRNHDRRRGTPQ